MKFRDLSWTERTDTRGNVNSLETYIEVKNDENYIVSCHMTIFIDNNDSVQLGITGSFEKDAPSYPFVSFEYAKTIADAIYQKNMNNIFQNIEKLIA